MRTIWKFPLHIQGEQVLVIPAQAFGVPAQVVKVAGQGDSPALWALVDPEGDKQERRFTTIPTGDAIPDGLDYVGSYLIMDGEFVGHVFERVA